MTLQDEMAVPPVPFGNLANLRQSRYQGEHLTCSLSEFAASSVEPLRQLYDWLESIGKHSVDDLTKPEVRASLENLLSAESVQHVVLLSRQLDSGDTVSMRLASMEHDLKSVALNQLVGVAELWRAGDPLNFGLRSITIFARDHAKVLRHTIFGLDEATRLDDLGYRLHGVENLRRRLPLLLLFNQQGSVHVDFDAQMSVDFATTCPEFSTVLKQMYNLMANAARHACDQTVLVRVFASPQAAGLNSVRLAVGNAISANERAALSPAVLSRLWRGFSVTGSGLGLLSIATLVADAFGLSDAAEAVDLSYVGSRLAVDGFVSWMHWPIAELELPTEQLENARSAGQPNPTGRA